MDKLVSRKELASSLGVHELTVYRMTREQLIPGFKIGKVWRYSENEVKDALRVRSKVKSDDRK